MGGGGGGVAERVMLKCALAYVNKRIRHVHLVSWNSLAVFVTGSP